MVVIFDEGAFVFGGLGDGNGRYSHAETVAETVDDKRVTGDQTGTLKESFHLIGMIGSTGIIFSLRESNLELRERSRRNRSRHVGPGESGWYTLLESSS